MRQGSTLIVALWALFLLGTIAVAVGVRASSSITLAEHMRVSAVIDSLARAGVERAIASVMLGDETKMTGEGSEYWSRDNDTFEKGLFSVAYATTDAGNTVTNFGVVSEGSLTNINKMAEIKTLLEQNVDRATALQLTENIRKYRLAKKILTRGGVNGRFQSIYELLLVDGMTEEIFEQIAPFVTVFDKNCYRGTAIGATDTADKKISGSSLQRHIEFVFDPKKRKIVYWNQ